ncbi:integrase arm-type DNA-binding domain-containing protein [Luteimonas sp. A277]
MTDLEVAPSGGKLWRWKYRYEGKEKRLALGAYPEVELAEARERHAEARKLLASGVDPGEHRKAQRAAAADKVANSFDAVARELLAIRAKRLSVGSREPRQSKRR